MARSITTISTQITAAVQSDTNLYDPGNPDPSKKGLTSTSAAAIWKLFVNAIAYGISFFEQVLDNYVAAIEAQVDLSAPGTPQWIQEQCFKFQYNVATPQVIQFDLANFNPYYPIVNSAYRLITQAAVSTNPDKTVLVKVAKDGPAPLTALEAAALTSYLDYLNFAGVYFQIVTAPADFIMMGYDIYYDGQYSASIQLSVTTAINDFLALSNFNNFNGITTLAKLEDVIQSVPGVKDVVAVQVEVRPFAVPVASAGLLVDNKQIISRNYQPFAGYMIIDTAPGRDLASKLNFIVSPN